MTSASSTPILGIPPGNSPVTLSDGTRLILYKDGGALQAAYDAIGRATRRICLEVYIFRSDSTGITFAKLLAEKARQGLAVYIIYDSFGSWDSSDEPFELMKSAGVKLCEFHPLNPWQSSARWRPLNRDHRKVLIIDDHIAGLGGLNIGAEYGSSSLAKADAIQNWRDSAIGIVGPGARLVLHSFAGMWKYIHSGRRIRRAEFIHDIDSGELGILASVPTLRSALRPFLLRLFHSATRSIDLTMAYFAPDDGLIEEICRAAGRHVRVRLMLPSRSDVKFIHTAAQSFYENLLSRGVEIYERQEAMLHAKTIVIDQFTTVIGSTNLDYRSIEFNCEISAVVRNREFGLQMESLFEDDVSHSQRILLEKWRYRPTMDRFTQWAVSRARYLM